MIPVNKRKIVVCILLSIITLGIYQIYWEYLLVKNIKALKKDNSSCAGEMLCLIFVPFYNYYWWFTRGKVVKDKFFELNCSASGNEVVYLILEILGLRIVSTAIMQNDFNSLPFEPVTQNVQKNNKLAILLKGIITENPVLILILGTCPTLATTGNVTSALSMGLAATVVLICSNIVISALRKVIPNSVRVPCYIVIIAAFVTAVQMLLQAFLPPIYEMLGVYLALIVVNCVILGRAEMFARKNTVIDSALDGLGMGLGFILALFLMAFIREVFGAGSFMGIEIPFMSYFKIPILAQSPGGFLVYGILIAIMNKLTEKKGGVKKKSFSCEGCPSAALCQSKPCLNGESTAKEETENGI